MHLRTARAATLGITILAAACGGGTTPPAATQGGGGGGATTPPAATQGAVATEPGAAATELPIATPSGGGNGGGEFTGSPCTLITTAEVMGVLGGDQWMGTETPMMGGSGGCIYETLDGKNLAATAITSGVNAPTLWGVYSTLPATDMQQVTGLASDAVWVTSSATLFVLKGTVLVGINAGTGSDEESKRLEWSKALATIALGRL